MKYTYRHPSIRKYADYCYRVAIYEDYIDPYDMHDDFRPLQLFQDYPRDLRGVHEPSCRIVEEVEIRWACRGKNYAHYDVWELYLCANELNRCQVDRLVAAGSFNRQMPVQHIHQILIDEAFR